MGLGQPAVGAGASVIAALLAETEAGHEDRAALYRRARGLLMSLSRLGPLTALCDIAASARSDAANEDIGADVRDAARETIAALAEPELAETLVDGAYDSGVLTPEAETLLAATAPIALWSIAPRLRDEPLHPVSRSLRVLVRRLDEEDWIEALSAADRRDFLSVAALFPLIRALPSRLIWPVASQLQRHRDPRVRHQVTAFLLGRPEPLESWRRLAADTLRDPDSALVDIARSAIVVHPDAGRHLARLALDGPSAPPPTGRLRSDLEALLDGEAPTPDGDDEASPAQREAGEAETASDAGGDS